MRAHCKVVHSSRHRLWRSDLNLKLSLIPPYASNLNATSNECDDEDTEGHPVSWLIQSRLGLGGLAAAPRPNIASCHRCCLLSPSYSGIHPIHVHITFPLWNLPVSIESNISIILFLMSFSAAIRLHLHIYRNLSFWWQVLLKVNFSHRHFWTHISYKPNAFYTK